MRLKSPATGMEPPEPVMAGEHHTTSFSIADRDGNLICVTQSIGSVFGSGVVVPGTGLCLNNFLYWSDVNPQSPNHTRPGAALRDIAARHWWCAINVPAKLRVGGLRRESSPGACGG